MIADIAYPEASDSTIYLPSWIIVYQYWRDGEETLKFLKRFSCLLSEDEFLSLEWSFLVTLNWINLTAAEFLYSSL